jgi:hypothetical protein
MTDSPVARQDGLKVHQQLQVAGRAAAARRASKPGAQYAAAAPEGTVARPSYGSVLGGERLPTAQPLQV